MFPRWGYAKVCRARRLVGLAALLTVATSASADLADARKLFDTGQYKSCIEECAKALAPAPPQTLPANDLSILLQLLPATPDAGWWVLKARAEMQIGAYEEATRTAEEGLVKHSEHLPLWLLRHQGLRMTGRDDDAKALLTRVQDMVALRPWAYFEPENRVAMGRILLLRGSDARQVLENYYDPARRDSPASLEVLFAIGELALAKYDPGVAGEAFEAARRVAPNDPDVYLGLARANDDDPELVTAAVEKALELNPSHVETLLLLADNLLGRERLEEATAMLEKVQAVNSKEPRAWAYRAVMAALRGKTEEAKAAREKALATWKTNPEVDHIIGRILSQRYRFEDGQAHQKQALAMAPDYAPARFQLCQDLLRTGHDEEGWKLAAQVFKDDPYNIMAFNLVTLHDNLAKFTTLSSDAFTVRMEAKEAPLYGKRVMDVLTKAREKLSAKYDVKLNDPTIIEIFPLQQDFEIRTFGFPGEEGFLGVCFGRLVTVNSPASRLARPTSWESILWHEFCHTVTLTKTRNKMPRWISEGISTYEERQVHPGWGERMVPPYREMIKKGGATKVSDMNKAFSQPPSPLHLQFAYYEASMIVEYIVNRYGTAAINAVLSDLGNDVQINDALSRHTAPIEKLDEEFAAWLVTQADQLAPGVNWEAPELLPEEGSAPLAAWNREHPESFPGLMALGQALLIERQWDKALEPLKKAQTLFPGYVESDNAYLLMAKAYQELKDVKAEREVLGQLLARNADVVTPRLRYMELAAADKDWKAVRTAAEGVLGVDPLFATPYRQLAEATESLGDRPAAIEARRAILMLNPIDKPEQRYRLARLLFEEGKLPEARREVVLCLEDAPRYRQGLGLLLEIAAKMDGGKPESAPLPAATVPAAEPLTPGARP